MTTFREKLVGALRRKFVLAMLPDLTDFVDTAEEVHKEDLDAKIGFESEPEVREELARLQKRIAELEADAERFGAPEGLCGHVYGGICGRPWPCPIHSQK